MSESLDKKALQKFALHKMVTALVLAIIALGAMPDDADAKRRVGSAWGLSSKKAPKADDDRKGSSLPIIVPGVALGSSTKKPIEVVKVADLPDTADFQREDGSYVDLGWRHIGETGGEWVGYVGSDADYLTVSPEQLTAIMQIAGITTLPEPPKRLGHADIDISGLDSGEDSTLWSLLQFAAFIYIIRAARRRFFSSSEAGTRDVSEPASDWMSQAEDRMAAAAAPRAPIATAPSARSTTVVRSGSSGFGRRA